MARVKAAIFDVGATLVTGPPVAPNKIIASLIKDISPAVVSNCIMTNNLSSAEEVCNKIEENYCTLTKDIQEEICGLWLSQLDAPVAIDGAEETVITLNSKGLRTALLSDIWNPYWEGVMHAIPRVMEIVETSVLSFETGFRKPAKENFLLVTDRLGLLPQECVMVGDTYTHDIHPAIELGMRTVWVLCRPEKEHESIIGILNGTLPAPTCTVADIKEVEALGIWED